MADSKVDSVLDQLKAAREAVSGKIAAIDEENGTLKDEINKIDKQLKELESDRKKKQSQIDGNESARDELVKALGGEPKEEPERKTAKTQSRKTGKTIDSEKKNDVKPVEDVDGDKPVDKVEKKRKTNKKKAEPAGESDGGDSPADDKAGDPWNDLEEDGAPDNDDVDIVDDGDVFDGDDDMDFL